jgi:hypothetical protein
MGVDVGNGLGRFNPLARLLMVFVVEEGTGDALDEKRRRVFLIDAHMERHLGVMLLSAVLVGAEAKVD